MEESRAICEVRNSGCTIWHGVTVKVGPRAARQAGVMKSVGSVFAPVLFTFEDGYAMPTGTTDLGLGDFREALGLLEMLWNTPSLVRPVPFVSLVAYHEYISNISAHSKLHTQAKHYFDRIIANRETGMVVHRVHGDATLENIIKIDGRVCWIDPSERIVPTTAELDIAKVLQSLLGYERSYIKEDSLIQDWIYKHTRHGGRASVDLILYYYVSHLIRLWPLQYLKRDWAISTLSIVENYL